MKSFFLKSVFIFFALVLFGRLVNAETIEEIQSQVHSLSLTLHDVQKKYNQSLDKVSALRKKISSQKKEMANLEKETQALKARQSDIVSELSEIEKILAQEKDTFKKFLSADFFNSQAEARLVALARALSVKQKSLFQSLTNQEITLFYEELIRKRELMVRSIVENEKKIMQLQIDLKSLQTEKETKKALLDDILQKSLLDKSEADAELKTLSERKLQLEGVQGALKAKQLRLSVALGGMEDKPTPKTPLEGEKPSFRIPVNGVLKREYNTPRTSRSLVERVAGIDFEASSRQVIAASSGKVRFSGVLKGFDYVVILEHPGNYYTFYAPLDGVVVNVGDNISEGGSIGNVKKDENFYFEVRKGQVSENPRDFLASYLKP